MTTTSSSPSTAAATTEAVSATSSTTTPPPTSSSSPPPPTPLTVYFVHPDLGIGGAERLVVDAAIGLQSLSSTPHSVTIFTSHHDPLHCFEETRKDLRVVVYGDWLPQSLLGGRGKIACAIARQLWLSLCLLLLHPRPSILIVDQLSVALPLFALLSPSTPLLFYCHYPDLKLASHTTLLQRLYRVPFDRLEMWSMSFAHLVMVNSRYTRQVYLSTFPSLSPPSHPPPVVVYPSINFSAYDSSPALLPPHSPTPSLTSSSSSFPSPAASPPPAAPLTSSSPSSSFSSSPLLSIPSTTAVFVSINRFERKKNIELALHAFSLLPHPLPPPFTSALLILAGGYDPLNPENVAYVPHLHSLTLTHHLQPSTYPDLSGSVVFLLSFSHAQRSALLARALAILYTPQHEHFGIVPVEAMYAQRVVIACNSGGPVESIEQGVTGWLCEPEAERFSEAMVQVMEMGVERREEMGRRGRERVKDKFAMDRFVGAFEEAIQRLVQERRMAMSGGDRLNSLLTAVALAMIALGVLLMLWD